MPELEKIGKVLDSKIKGLTESRKKIIDDGTVVKPSVLEQLMSEQNDLFTGLGKIVYENRKAEMQPEYEKFFEEIQNKQQLIDAEMIKKQGKRCQKCGASLMEGVLFCPLCGEKVIEPTIDNSRQCPGCGAYLKAGAKFCVKCGEKLL
ncbi:hypothetical protein CBFG_02924 [Clostridiales bacterium 1_7_47FAA]|uniref:Zinc ribbon domain-containing protein n=1 Tax=Enterocloster hominis (ex Hitch et al. 2024) TaxID=1917870 RepID=A0ABV1D5W7_9FIRM|nr:hypothetical protein CBFG_02924 [Clostridiales bacterium 1_7_47FAA]